MSDNNIDITEDESYCPHCWHQTGIMLTSDPPQIQVRCCYCGIYKYIRQNEPIDQSKHGQFLPNNKYLLKK